MNSFEYIIPENYKTQYDFEELQLLIEKIKETFEKIFSESLNLIKIQSPLFVSSKYDLNDGLNGETPVYFNDINDEKFEIVHSLAKWKRYQLCKLNKFNGIITIMNAIRREENYDNIHSIYVDQWDWEMKINERSLQKLKVVVNKIFRSIKQTIKHLNLDVDLPEKVFFIHSQELEFMYPNLTPKERENEITKKEKFVCLIGIGCNLMNSNLPHDNRAVDYDDWSTEVGKNLFGLNADLLVYHKKLNRALEISSMGIRVNSKSLFKQLRERKILNQEFENLKWPDDLNLITDKLKNYYKHDVKYISDILQNNLPQSIGGGIGISRFIMWVLDLIHIGEIQVSNWPDKKTLIENGISILE